MFGFFFHTQRLNGQIAYMGPHSKSFWGNFEAFLCCNYCFSFSSAHSSAPPTSLGLPPFSLSGSFSSQQAGNLLTSCYTLGTKKRTCPNSVSCRFVFSWHSDSHPRWRFIQNVLLLLNSTGYFSPFFPFLFYLISYPERRFSHDTYSSGVALLSTFPSRCQKTTLFNR